MLKRVKNLFSIFNNLMYWMRHLVGDEEVKKYFKKFYYPTYLIKINKSGRSIVKNRN